MIHDRVGVCVGEGDISAVACLVEVNAVQSQLPAQAIAAAGTRLVALCVADLAGGDWNQLACASGPDCGETTAHAGDNHDREMLKGGVRHGKALVRKKQE
jgi:hypothetical protein